MTKRIRACRLDRGAEIVYCKDFIDGGWGPEYVAENEMIPYHVGDLPTYGVRRCDDEPRVWTWEVEFDDEEYVDGPYWITRNTAIIFVNKDQTIMRMTSDGSWETITFDEARLMLGQMRDWLKLEER